MPVVPQFVLGYGSLVPRRFHDLRRDRDPRGFVADLPGRRRAWAVAMDNARDLPGYKHYVDRGDPSSRPAVHVAFLDVVPDDGGTVNGVCLPVASDDLDALDRRERNYARTDVTDLIADAPGRIWTYVGTDEARDRAAAARADGTLVVQRDYVATVREGFAALGEAELRRFEASTDEAGCPVRDLERREL